MLLAPLAKVDGIFTGEADNVKNGMTDAERASVVAELYQVMQEQILDDSHTVEVSIDRGLDLDKAGLETITIPNDSMTILVRINGGASGTAYPLTGSSIDFGK